MKEGRKVGSQGRREGMEEGRKPRKEGRNGGRKEAKEGRKEGREGGKRTDTNRNKKDIYLFQIVGDLLIQSLSPKT